MWTRMKKACMRSQNACAEQSHKKLWLIETRQLEYKNLLALRDVESSLPPEKSSSREAIFCFKSSSWVMCLDSSCWSSCSCWECRSLTCTLLWEHWQISDALKLPLLFDLLAIMGVSRSMIPGFKLLWRSFFEMKLLGTQKFNLSPSLRCGHCSSTSKLGETIALNNIQPPACTETGPHHWIRFNFLMRNKALEMHATGEG